MISSATQIWFNFWDFSLVFALFCEILNNLTFLGLKQLFKLNHVRSSEGKCLFGGTAHRHLKQLHTAFNYTL